VDKRTGTLTVQLKKGLHGLMQGARLWYEKLSGDLRDLGFKANKSDECVFNRTEADGSQTTLVLHVDGVLVTAKTTADVKRFLSDIGKKYSDLTIHEGPELDFLGMHPSWSTVTSTKCWSLPQASSASRRRQQATTCSRSARRRLCWTRGGGS
jgi:hypothetical protein